MSRGRGNLDPKRVSSELFTLTYGCMVAQLLKDFDSPDEVCGMCVLFYLSLHSLSFHLTKLNC